jgi:two-component SAPR family response regulator
MATLTVEQVEQISAKLKELPAVENKKRPVSKQEAIKLLAKDIKAMQARGYTLEQVSEQLKQLGVSTGNTNSAQLSETFRRRNVAKEEVYFTGR